MTRIVLITSYVPSLINFRAPLIRTLHARGIEVVAVAPYCDDSSRDAVKALGAIPIYIPISRTGTNPLCDAINTWRLARLLKLLRPDVTLGYFIKPVIFGTLAAWWAGVPRRFAMVEGLGFVFTPTGNALPLKRRLLKRLVLWLYKLGLSRAERVIFLNPDDQAELVAAGALPVHKGFLLGGIGIDFAHWQTMPPVLQPPTFLMVARLLREKGVEQYAAAARIVKQNHPQARFLLLGGLDDNPGSISEADVQSWVAEGILEWHGHTAVPQWMAQASVYVLPSYREGVPVSSQEAMAMGRAVITTDVPGCRQTVVDGVNGFLVPPRDAQALAEKMEIFIAQPELIATMGHASRRMAEERFDVHKVNQRLIDLLLPGEHKSAFL
ncbi:MAG: glycosyltransferase family 4 protein [Alcaligenes sp.]|nr:glycosyltransferase family 4 protein [Alcaligenes sp.]